VTTSAQGAAGRIVVGVDGSESGNAALAWAVRQAGLTGSGVDAVITWSIPISAEVAGGLPETYDPVGDAKTELTEAVAAVHAANPKLDLRSIVIDGAPGPSLVDYSAAAELLVVGSRGHGFLAGLLLGSVSEYCVSHAQCPVVVVRHPHTA
jgi:nucleotide-binding universal stress UspA family protein